MLRILSLVLVFDVFIPDVVSFFSAAIPPAIGVSPPGKITTV